MRMITDGDPAAAARMVLCRSAEIQHATVISCLERAHAADRFRKRLHRPHPLWGNGSLMAVVLGEEGAQSAPYRCDTDYLRALAVVIDTLIDWRSRVG